MLYDLISEIITSKIAFVVHLYYIEMLDDLCVHLDELRKHTDFDVFVTTGANYANPVQLREITQRLQAKEVEIVENRGRDVLPFFNMLPKLKGYDYACKLHTKTLEESTLKTSVPSAEKGLYYHCLGDDYMNGTNRQCKNNRLAYLHWMIGAELGNEQCKKNMEWFFSSGIETEIRPDVLENRTPFGRRYWRDEMWESLVNPDKAREAIEALRAGEGVYAPNELWLTTCPHKFFDNNTANMRRLGDVAGVVIHNQPFIAGTMFWFRPEALMWLTEFDLDGLFGPEDGASDGRMEHAFERAFHQLARDVGTMEHASERPSLQITRDVGTKVSVVMASYLEEFDIPSNKPAGDRESKFIRAVESFIKQTYTDTELIIVSDGCNKTIRIYEERYADNDKIILVKIPKQEFFSGKMRQAGLEVATGDLICYLDSDDMFGESHIQILAAEANGSDWYFYDDFTFDGQVKNRRMVRPEYTKIGTSSFCHHRSLNLAWQDGYAGDWYTIQTILELPHKRIKTPEYLVCHIAHMNLDY